MLLVVFLHYTKKLQVGTVDMIHGVKDIISKDFVKLLVFLVDTVRKEAATIAAVFPSPNEVMSILVQVSNSLLFV